MGSRSTVDYCASNQGAFFGNFVAAMTKLGRIGVKTPATGGEIRRDCRFPNELLVNLAGSAAATH